MKSIGESDDGHYLEYTCRYEYTFMIKQSTLLDYTEIGVPT